MSYQNETPPEDYNTKHAIHADPSPQINEIACDIPQLISVRIDRRTYALVKPGKDVKKIKKRYKRRW